MTESHVNSKKQETIGTTLDGSRLGAGIGDLRATDIWILAANTTETESERPDCVDAGSHIQINQIGI